MPYNSDYSDYHPLNRPRKSKRLSEEFFSDGWKSGRKRNPESDHKNSSSKFFTYQARSVHEKAGESLNEDQGSLNRHMVIKRGHSVTYAALFLFTVILYARPAEFYPSPLTASIAFIIGIMTLAIFVPSQLGLDGNLTARPREVNLVLLFLITGLLSIPLAISPSEAWDTFTDTFIRCIVIFIVMVNVVRTEARLKGLLFLAIIVSIWLSLGAVNDYRLGLAAVEGYRAGGRGSGIFGNSNDMALHLVTIIPITVAFFFGRGGPARKILFGGCSLLMIAAVVVTYSRGGFIGLLIGLSFTALKIGRQRRVAVAISGLIIVIGVLALAPGNYGTRLLSIFFPSLDPVGSSDMRREILYRSIWTSLRHPLFGIGMGNFHIVSVRELVSHNAYTQVAAEMGMAALVFYTMFIVTPFKRLGQIANETFASRANSQYHYLAIGLQASLLGYMVTSFFASVAYIWYVYYLVAYAVCFRRIYESETGGLVVIKDLKSKDRPVGAGGLASPCEPRTIGEGLL